MSRDHYPPSVFVMVGMTEYDEHDNLETLRELVPQLCDALRQFGFTHELAELADGGAFGEVNAALGTWEPPHAAARLLYWVGHGYRDHSGDFLLVRDTPARKINASTAISAGTLASGLAGLPPGHTALIIDTCFAGAAATEVTKAVLDAFDRQTYPEGAPSISIVACCGPHDRVQDGQFTKEFLAALQHGHPTPAWSAGNHTVRLYDVVESVRDVCRQNGHPEPDILMKGWGDLVFPNPRAIDLPPDDAETQRDRQQRLLSHSRGDHFFGSARGIEVDETGWFFTGRTELLRAINGWLRRGDDAGGMLIVTGSPGTGKSAVLGRIATLSDPAYRRLAEEEGALAGAEQGTVPDIGLIDVAVHAKNKSLREVQDAIATALGLETPEGGWPSSEALIDRITMHNPRVRLIVDALDEAVQTAVVAIASDLLRPLAARQGISILVGTRAQITRGGPNSIQPGYGPLIDQLDPERRHVYILDNDLSTPDSISRYVRRRLMETPRSPYVKHPVSDEDLNSLISAVTDASGVVFLFARLVTRALLTREEPLLPGHTDVTRLLAGQAKDVFKADLDRFQGAERMRVNDLLRALAWADGNGFPRWPIWPAVASALSDTGATYGVNDVDWVLENAGYHITEAQEDGQAVYRLYHQALVDYFRETDQANG
jgi:hypothetical protein